MFQLIIRKQFRSTIYPLFRSLSQSFATIPNRTVLTQKKKAIYQSKLSPSSSHSSTLTSEELANRQKVFEDILFEMGKELSNYFNIKTASTKGTVNVVPIISRHKQRILKEFPLLTAIELINFIEIIKNLSIQRMEHIEDIEVVYQQLQKIIKQGKGQNQVVNEHFKTLWDPTSNFVTQIRSNCLLQYTTPQHQTTYLNKIVPHVRHFKSVNMLILLYQKWKFKFNYSYQLLDQIHNNDYFLLIDEINQCYIKMLFMESIKGQFTPSQDGIFTPILGSFQQHSNLINQAAFDKYLKLMHLQGSMVQTETSRNYMQYALNTFINIAKNQQYDAKKINLQQLVDIYLGFQQTNSTGQILLSQITYLSKISKFNMTEANFKKYKQLLDSVLNNIQKQLKYERRDYLNKEYTFDTINFLKQFLPKYIPLWPEVILQVNNAHSQLFEEDDQPLLDSFEQVFNSFLVERKSQISFGNKNQFLLKILKFLWIMKDRPQFKLNDSLFESLLKEFILKYEVTAPSNQHYECLYLILKLLGQKSQKEPFQSLFNKINKNIIQKLMDDYNQKSKIESQIVSRAHSIIWLALCHANLKLNRFRTDDSIAQIFVNNQLYYMLNSLQYTQVYQMLIYTLSLQRLNIKIYEKLLLNLSTFVIFISQQTTKHGSNPVFYLNHEYAHLFVPIVDLVLKNKTTFCKIQNKECFKIIQIFMLQDILSYPNHKIMTLLDIIQDPSYLSPSMLKHLSTRNFSISQFENYDDSSRIRQFEYYNESVLRYFEGKYNQKEIKNLLKSRTLSQKDMQEYFSKIQVYKTIIMDGSLILRFEIPEPNTSTPDFKSMYICQKIFQKIEKAYYQPQQQFSFFPPETEQFHEVNLTQQINYIKRQIFTGEDFDHEFKISNRNLPRYMKVQVWKNFIFCQKEYQIDPKDMFQNSKKLVDQILIKVVKGVLGKYEKIREAIKEFSCNEDIISQLQEANIEFQQHGAAIELKNKYQSKNITVICTNNTNYKILYICAYYLSKQGAHTLLLRQDQSISSMMRHLKEQLVTVSDRTDREEEQEIEYIEEAEEEQQEEEDP